MVCERRLRPCVEGVHSHRVGALDAVRAVTIGDGVDGQECRGSWGRAKRGTGEDAVVSMPDVEMRAGDAGSAMISDAAGESRHAHAGRRLW